MSFIQLILCLSFLVLPAGCGYKLTNSGTTETDRPQNQQADTNLLETKGIHKIRIGSEVIAAIRTQIAGYNPMRGGNIFGDIKQGTADIKYFLYDYASKPSGGAYAFGDNVSQNIGIALAYQVGSKPVLSTYLGSAHSKPGTMSYVLSQNDEIIEDTFKLNPQLSNFILPIITIGESTMKKIEPNELKIGDNAKISFFVKERGKKTVPINNIETYESNAEEYKALHSYVSIFAHLQDMEKKFSLKDLGYENTKILQLKDGVLAYVLNFGKKLDIAAAIKNTYPNSPPTLFCLPKDEKGKYSDASVEIEAKDWQPNEQDPKNFQKFFEDFITKKCRPQNF